MSVATLLAVVLIAAAQITADTERRVALHAYFGGVVIVLSVIALTGYLIDSHILQAITVFQGLSVPTAVSVLLLAVAAIFSRPRSTWLSILVAPGAGGRLARRYLPWAFVIPILLGQFAVVLTESGIVDSGLRLLAFTVVFVVLASCAVIVLAHVLSASERRDLGSRQNLQAILSGLNAAIFVLDEKGEVLGRNQAADQMFGVNVDRIEDLTQLAFYSMPDRVDLTAAQHPVTKVLRQSQQTMAGWLDPMGNEKVLRFTSFDTEGEATRFRVVVIADVTEPWMLQQTVAQSERADALAQLVSGVSHEMLNVFGVINLAAGSVEPVAPDASRVITKASTRGSDLAEKLQKLTMVHNGAVTVVETGDSLHSAVELARRALPDSIILDANISDVRAPVACEGSELELAILNLILNARNAIVDAGQEDGRIKVSLRTNSAEAIIWVSDNGPGIPAALIDRVKEPFFSTRRDRGGTGLGLATVSDFAAKNGGQFLLGDGENGGAVAEVILPISHELADPQDDGQMLQSLDGLSILVSDGDPDFLAILSDTLILLGAKVARAASGQEALAALSDGAQFDLVITDHVLTGPMDGGQLVETLRRRCPGLAVIYMASGMRGSAPVDVSVAGMTLRKPINMAHLTNAILKVCGREGGVRVMATE
ncbi:ATP-binding protein [Pseudooceanicola sp. MF1-13]|uniref:ATP-binding protein n=1 Tax=Pseudooceanicola sp. MF1-13 TaxID=3379095 RepID=UPI00389248CE